MCSKNAHSNKQIIYFNEANTLAHAERNEFFLGQQALISLIL